MPNQCWSLTVRCRALNQRAEKLDQVFAAAGVDRQWSTATVADIHGTVDSVGGGRVARAECASRLCRVLIEHPSLNEQRGFAEQIWRSPPFDQGVYFYYDKAGAPPTTTLYVARQGTPLASLGR